MLNENDSSFLAILNKDFVENQTTKVSNSRSTIIPMYFTYILLLSHFCETMIVVNFEAFGNLRNYDNFLK